MGHHRDSTATRRRWLSRSLLIGQLLAASTIASAQSGSTQQQFQSAVDAGLAEFNAHRYVEARALFERAHALRPSGRTLRALGLTAFALDDFTSSHRDLQAALASQEDPLQDTQRREAQELLDWMNTSLGRLRLQYVPDTAVANLDGQRVAEAELLVAPGKHRVRITATGYLEYEQSFVVEASSTPHVFQIALRAVPNQTKPSAVETSESPLWLWIGGGGLLLTAGGATAFGLGRMQIDKAERPGPPFVSAQEGEAQSDRGRMLTGVGIAAGALGVVAITSALILHLGGRRSDRTSSMWRCDAGAAQLCLRGTF